MELAGNKISRTHFEIDFAFLFHNNFLFNRCRMSDGSGDINLLSLGSKNSNPTYTVTDDIGGYWSYQYNPCVPFTSGSYTDLAVMQSTIDSNIVTYYFDCNIITYYFLFIQSSLAS